MCVYQSVWTRLCCSNEQSHLSGFKTTKSVSHLCHSPWCIGKGSTHHSYYEVPAGWHAKDKKISGGLVCPWNNLYHFCSDSLVRTIQRLYPTTMEPRVTVLPRVQKGNQEYLLRCTVCYHSLLNSNSRDKEYNWLHLTVMSFTLQSTSLLAGGEWETVHFTYVWEHGMDDEDGKTIQGSQAKQINHNI